MDDEILKLKEKLCQCQLERERLRTQRENLMIKEKLALQEREELEEKLRVAREATLSATSEYERKKKPLKEALDSKTMSVHLLSNALDELDANCEEPYMAARSAAASDKLNRLINIPHEERDKLIKLHSEINEKRDKLLAFLKTCVKNSRITDDVKPLLLVHYDAYVGTLNVDDGCEMRKYVARALQPGSAQKQILKCDACWLP